MSLCFVSDILNNVKLHVVKTTMILSYRTPLNMILKSMAHFPITHVKADRVSCNEVISFASDEYLT